MSSCDDEEIKWNGRSEIAKNQLLHEPAYKLNHISKLSAVQVSKRMSLSQFTHSR
jgi:hypothetical protein